MTTETKILLDSKILKKDQKKEIAKLNYQISNKQKELLVIVKENKENTIEIFELLNTYLLNDEKSSFKNLLENHLLFNAYSNEFYDKLFNLNSTEKKLVINKLYTWFNKYSVSGLKQISIDLEKHLI